MLMNSWLLTALGGFHNRSRRGADRRVRRTGHLPASVAVEYLESRQLLSGQTIVVNSTADDTSTSHVTLRDAIQQADKDGNGDTIKFASNLTGTIMLTQGQLDVTGSMTIIGPGAGLLAVSGASKSRIFDITNKNAEVNISRLTLENGNVGTGVGGAILCAGALTLANDTLSNNTASNGSAIMIEGTGTLTSASNTFARNHGTSGFPSGATIYNDGHVTSTQDTITQNIGSGIENVSGTVTTTDDTISRNTAGGITNFSTLVTKMDTIFENVLDGIDNASGTLTSTHDTISLNAGSGIQNGPFNASADIRSSHAICTDDTITQNVAGILNAAGILISTDDTISGNVSGIVSEFGGFLISTTDTIANNKSAGIAIGSGTVTTTNDTIAGNLAGGVDMAPGSTWNSTNTIVAGNSVADVGNLFGTIIATYTLIGDSGTGAGGITATSANHNIVGVAANKIFVTDQNGKPVLANNGGPTETIALVSGSAAISKGGTLGKVTADNGATLTVSNITFITVGDVLNIAGEIVVVMGVTSGSGTTGTLKVLRGQDGSTQKNLANQSMILEFDERGIASKTYPPNLGAY